MIVRFRKKGCNIVTNSKDKFTELYEKHPETLCLYPFTHMNFRGDGKIAPCFRSKSISQNFYDGDFNKVWNSDEWKKLRLDLINGKKSDICSTCWKTESKGVNSYRQTSLHEDSINTPWRSQLNLLDCQTGEMPLQIKQSELRFSNICNLKCKMCSPVYSTQWQKEMKKKTDLWQWLIDNDTYTTLEKRITNLDFSNESASMISFIKQNAPNLSYLMITGGEPFIDTAHTEALEILKPYSKNITLEYTSNLNTLTDKANEIFLYWEKYKAIRLKISIDGDPPIYDQIRVGGDHEAMEKNIKRIIDKFPLQDFPKAIRQKFVLFGTCTVSRYNISRLHFIANYITKLGCLFLASHVDFPDFISAQSLSNDQKKEITDTLMDYVNNAEERIYWGPEKIWKNTHNKETQIRRVKRFITNAVKHMNGQETTPQKEAKFIEYEKVFSLSLKGHSCNT